MKHYKCTLSLILSLGVMLLSIVCASASAEVFKLENSECTGGTGLAICWSEAEAATSPLLELKGKQSVTETGGLTKLLTAKLTVECEKTGGSGVVVQEKPLEGGSTTIEKKFDEFTGCVVAAPEELKTKCRIHEGKILTAELVGQLTSQTNITVKPAGGTTLASITLESAAGQTCPATIAGTRALTGEQEVTIIDPDQHELTKSGEFVKKSKLKFLSEAAELSGTTTLSFTGLEDWLDIGIIA